MKNYEDEPWANDYTPTTDIDDALYKSVENQEMHDAEITRLFVDARDKLIQIEANAIKQKKQIVVELAKSLEGKIATDSICMEIIDQLRVQVSASFIRQCLDEKYKQKIRVENARKQNQKQNLQLDEKLATLPSLNQEDGENKKEIIMVDVDGRTSVREDGEAGDEQPVSQKPFATKEMNFVTKETITEESEQPISTESEAGNPSPKYEHLDAVEPEYNQDNSRQMIAASNNTVCIESPDYNSDSDDDDHILHFEFSLPYRKISEHMRLLFRGISNDGNVWFSGIIDKSTGKVTSSKLGRI